MKNNMKVTFIYDEEKDIDCILAKGGTSMNSPKPTKTYEQLLQYTEDLSDREKVREFVRLFRDKEVDKKVQIFQSGWDKIGDEYEKRAERVFGVILKEKISAYLTITGRYPYNIEGKYFYVPDRDMNVNPICMHELWHFYTWERFGPRQDTVGPAVYNNMKEALTALLNSECADLMSGEVDSGYPQHQNLRKKVTEVWNTTKDIESVWDECVKSVSIQPNPRQ